MYPNQREYCAICLYHVFYIDEYSPCKVCKRPCCTDCVPTDRITLCSLNCVDAFYKSKHDDTLKQADATFPTERSRPNEEHS